MPKATTTTEDREFAESVLSLSCLLDESLEWVAANLNPEDVFDDDDLSKWALENGFAKVVGDGNG